MGRNKKIKSSKNLNKWRKGDSCCSNPGNDKHRKLALEQRFSLIKLDNKALTVSAVEAHTAGITVEDQGTLRADDVDSVDFKSNKSCRTFATNFTTCTIPAFEKFFEKYTTKSVCHNRMLSVHAVVQEEIKNSNLAETSTSYLLGLMKCFDSLNSEEDIDATLKLVSMVIKKANPAVLQHGFGSFFNIFYDIFKKNSESKYVLTNLFGCLSILLRAQQPQEWTTPLIKHVIKKMLDYTVCEIPKTRHSAQYNLAAIMKGSCFIPDYDNEENTTFVQHPIALFIGEFIFEEVSNSINMKNTKSTLHLLIFLKLCISSLPSEILEKICKQLLQIIYLGDVLVKKCSLEVIAALFKANVTSLSGEQLSSIIIDLTFTGDRSKGLLLVPNINDSTVCGVWMSVVTQGIVRIVQLNRNCRQMEQEETCFRMVTSWFEQLVYCWNSDHTSIHDDVSDNIDILLSKCIAPLDQSQMNAREAEICQILLTISKGLSFQCQNAWECVFKSIASAIQVIGPYLPQAVVASVKKVSEFSSEQHKDHWKFVDHTIGKAIVSIGVEEVLKVLPIQITGNIQADGMNSWILPIITRHVANGSLCFFRDYFVHLADKCSLIIKSLRDKGTQYAQLVKEYETVELQLWRLFPKFAKAAVDQEEFLFPSEGKQVHGARSAIVAKEFLKRLCKDLIAREDIRKEIILGLCNMAENCPSENPGKLADFAKNYIPVLFNLFLTKPKALATEGEPGITNTHRLDAKRAVKLFFRITPQNVMESHFEELVNKLTNDKEDPLKKRFLVILLREFVPHLSAENIQIAYDIIDKYLPKQNKKSRETTMQKSAYRVLEKICQTKTEACCNFASSHYRQIVDVLRLEPRKNAVRSKLTIMHILLENLPTTLNKSEQSDMIAFFIENAVKYCERTYCKSSRTAAYLLLFAIGTTLEKLSEISTKKIFNVLFTLLPSPDTDAAAATKIDIIMALLIKYKEAIDCEMMADVLKEVFANLIKNSSIISGACLTFLSEVFRFWSISFMSEFVDDTVRHLSMMDRRCREGKHRQMVRKVICRLFRRFGVDRVKAAIPERNIVMRKVLKNLITLEAQKSKERVKKDRPTYEMDEDEEITPKSGLTAILQELDIDIDDEGVKKHQMPRKILKELCLKEGGEDDITDLLDPSSVFTRARKVRFAPEEKPTPVPASAGFKIDAKTGKFIIEEETNAKSKRDENDDFIKMIANDSLYEGSQKRKLAKDDDTDEDEINPTPQKKRKILSKPYQKNRKGKSFGSEFKAKRAGGDIKKKGVQPYAYVKLDRRILNRRLQSKQAGQFMGIVKKGIRQAPRKMAT